MEILSIRPKAHGNRFLMADMWTEILRVGERGHRDREKERELVFNAQSTITVISGPENERDRDRGRERKKVGF